MTESEKSLVISLWNSGETMASIIQVLPYSKYRARQEIKQLQQDGILVGRSGKTQSKTKEKILCLYNDGITSPYEIAEILNFKVGTVNTILSNAKLDRKRPEHNYKKRKQTNFNLLCDKTKEIIVSLQEGLSVREVAKKFDVATQYVYEIKGKFVKEQQNGR